MDDAASCSVPQIGYSFETLSKRSSFLLSLVQSAIYSVSIKQEVRRAQEAVLRSRPFSETLERILGGLLQRVKTEGLDLPLLEARTVKKVRHQPSSVHISGGENMTLGL